MRRIHPTAVVDPAAVLAEDVEVGAHAVIEGPVKVGARTVVRPHAVLLGDTTLGEGNVVHPGAVLGERFAGQDTTEDGRHEERPCRLHDHLRGGSSHAPVRQGSVIESV